jgi:hypothetical protein
MTEQPVAPTVRTNRYRLTPPVEIAGTVSGGTESQTVTTAEVQVTASTTTTVALRCVQTGSKFRGPAPVLTVATEVWNKILLGGSVAEPQVLSGHEASCGYYAFGAPVFLGPPQPGQVSQGLLGNCRIASALQAIAVARPDVIVRAFATLTSPYTLRIRPSINASTLPSTSGPPTNLTVSEHLPVNRLEADCTPSYTLRTRLLASAPTGTATWPALLEKVFALVWPGYPNLDGGMEMPVYGALGLGKPYQRNFMDGTVKLNSQTAAALTKAWREGTPLTAPSRFNQHNYAVVYMCEDFVVISDPNKSWAPDQAVLDAEFYKTGDRGPFVYPGDGFKVWPLRFTWDDFFNSFRWVYGATDDTSVAERQKVLAAVFGDLVSRDGKGGGSKVGLRGSGGTGSSGSSTTTTTSATPLTTSVVSPGSESTTSTGTTVSSGPTLSSGEIPGTDKSGASGSSGSGGKSTDTPSGKSDSGTV